MNAILLQLGSNRFLSMTGAKDLVSSGDKKLTMNLPATLTKGRVNRLTVELKDNDTYTITTYKYRRPKLVEIETVSDIYVESLRRQFTRLTGLDTSL